MKNIILLLPLFIFALVGVVIERCEAGTPSLKYLAHSFVKMKTSEGKIIFIDPYYVNDFSDSADVVLITHEHSDHNSLTRVIRKSTCQVIRCANALLGGVYQTFTIGNIIVKAVPAYGAYHPKSDCVGYVVEFDSIKVYHAGDTDKIPEMADLASQNITYALLPMYAPEEMTQAAAIIQAKHDIPIHTNYPVISYNFSMVLRFTSPTRMVVLPGQTIELTNDTTSYIGKILRVPQEYPTIQTAIDLAKNSDTVLVSEGTYYENIKFRGKGVLLTSRYLLTKDWQTIFSTIIDGSTAPNKDTASTVQFLWREDSTAILNGFTIRGGTGTKYMFPNGTGTYPYQEGAGIVLHYSSAIIRNNFIVNNTMIPVGSTSNGGGGGIASMYGNPCINNNIITANTAGYAGGIVLNWSGGKIKNNLVYGNSAVGPYGGGGMMVWKVSANTAFVENNTIANNSSTSAGGGMILNLLDGSSVPVIKNNIVWANTQASGLQFTLAQYGTYNDIQDYTGGTNISIDPQFLSESRYKLASFSPCIDAGDTSMACNDKEDPANVGYALFPSLGGLRNDMGAYGGCGTALFPNETSTGINERKAINHNFKLFQNYPNPFNPTTNIKFQIVDRGFVSLKIFDILGREVAVLMNENKPKGYYDVPWDASQMPSGIYFYRLTANNYSQVKKMNLIK